MLLLAAYLFSLDYLVLPGRSTLGFSVLSLHSVTSLSALELESFFRCIRSLGFPAVKAFGLRVFSAGKV